MPPILSATFAGQPGPALLWSQPIKNTYRSLEPNHGPSTATTKRPQTHQRCCPSQIELPENSTKVELFQREMKKSCWIFHDHPFVAKKCGFFSGVFFGTHCKCRSHSFQRPASQTTKPLQTLRAPTAGDPCSKARNDDGIVSKRSVKNQLLQFSSGNKVLNEAWHLRMVSKSRPRPRPRPPGCLYITVTHRLVLVKCLIPQKKPQKQQLI